jgi:hypothetical protein
MRELNERDLRILKKGFLESLNKAVNEDEDKCIEKSMIFEDTGLGAFSPEVIPSVVQELKYEGLVEDCEAREEVKITRKGKQRLRRTDENNTYTILQTLATYGSAAPGLTGKQLEDLSQLTPGEINYAVANLEESDLVEAIGANPIYPFTFDRVVLTSRGKYQTDQLTKISDYGTTKKSQTEIVGSIKTSPSKAISLIPILPIGSPFGFTPEDWGMVTENKRDPSKIYIVFGFQLKSQYYDADNLEKNVKKMFQTAVEEYNELGNSIILEFDNLSGGYGHHLFNKIARDIISSDIAVFDASDLNPNVMIEIGVALTWGTKLLLIREKSSPKPPSDISGQMWADYMANAPIFSNSKHQKELLIIVKLAARQKQRVSSKL